MTVANLSQTSTIYQNCKSTQGCSWAFLHSASRRIKRPWHPASFCMFSCTTASVFKQGTICCVLCKRKFPYCCCHARYAATWHWDIATELYLKLKALHCCILLCNVEGRDGAEGRGRPVEVGEECQKNDTLKQQEDRAESWPATVCNEEMPHTLQTMHPFNSLPKRVNPLLAGRYSNPAPLPSRPVSGRNRLTCRLSNSTS